MRRHRIATIFVLLSFILVARGRATPIQYECESTVFVYLDRSESLQPAEQEILADRLGDLLKTSAKGLVADRKSVRIVPFAEKVGVTSRIPPGTDPVAIKDEILKAFSVSADKLGVGDTAFTNIFEMVGDMYNEINSLHASPRSAVFIIISDFVHDVTEGDDSWAAINDEKDWRDRKSGILDKLYEKFQNSDGPLLLLIPVPAAPSSLTLGKEVQDELERLTPYDGQVRSAVGGSFDLGSVLHFLEPMIVKSTIRNFGGERINEVTVTNRSCVSLPDLRLRRVWRKSGARIKEERDANGKSLVFQLDLSSSAEESFSFKIDEAMARAESSGELKHRPEVVILIEQAGRPSDIPLADLPVNLDEYIFLTRFKGTATDSNNGIEDNATRFVRSYWSGDVRFRLTLMGQGTWTLGESDEIMLPSGPGSPLDAEPKLVKVPVRIELDKDRVDLQSLCFDEEMKKRKDLFMKLEAFPVETLMQEGLLPVVVRTYDDGQRDLLERLAQQASLPALATLFTLLFALLFTRHLSLGQAEGLVAAAGFLWITIFLLAHQIPRIARELNPWLTGSKARLVGSIICVLLCFVIAVASFKGTLFPVKEASRIDVRIERDIAKGRKGLKAPRVSLVWGALGRVIGVGVFVFVVLWIGHRLYFGPNIPECALELVDDLGRRG